jgi:hypothetical protein
MVGSRFYKQAAPTVLGIGAPLLLIDQRPNQPVERIAADGRLIHCRTRWSAAIAHIVRSAT